MVHKNLRDKLILIRDMRDALGRMSCVYGALASDRPFLGPLYSVVSVSNPSSVQIVPLFVLIIIEWLRERLRKRRSVCCAARDGAKRESFRIDAEAEGSQIVVGGWEHH